MRKPRRLSTASRAIAQTKIIIVLVLVLILALIIFLKRSRRAEEEGTRGAPSQAAARAAATPAKVPTGKTHAADQILPATTYFLLTAPDLKSAVEQYKKTALCEIVNDPAMKESLAHLFDSIDELKAKVDVQYGLSLSEFLQALHGQCAFALLPPEEAGKSPAVVLIADAPTEAQRLNVFVDNVLKKYIVSPASWMPTAASAPKAPPRPTREARTQPKSAAGAQGVEISSAVHSDIPFFSAELDDTFILSSSRKAVEEAAALKASAGGAGSLAASPLFKEMRDKLGAQKEIVSAFLNIESLLADHRTDITAEALEALEGAGLAKVKALAYSAWFEEAGVKERLLIEMPGPRTGMVSLLSQPPTKRELLKFVPDSALWCASLGMEPSSFWKTLSSVVATNDSHPIADFEKETGLDVQRDLAPVLGDEVAVYGGPPEFEKAGAVANLVLVFKSANPLAASQTFEKVLKDIAARWPAPPPPAEPEGAKPPAKPAAPPGSKPENAPVASQTSPTGGPAKGKEAAPPPVKVAAFFSDVPYRNHVIRVLTLPEKGHAPNLSLTAGVDYVIIARTPDLARYALDAVDNLRPSLRSDAAFADLARHVASGESALVYFNTKASLDVVQRLSRERGQELFREQTLSIDYSKLPLADVISRHALGSVLVAVNDKTGLKFEAYSPAGLAATLLLAGLEHSAGMPASLDPRNVLVGCVAANNLAMIGAALRRYAQDHNGSFPPGGNQAHELVSSGRVRNLRLFYMPLSNVDFSGFPDNIDLQFTILNCTLSDDPKTMIAWDRHKDPMGGRHVLRLDGSVQWLSDQQFMDQIK